MNQLSTKAVRTKAIAAIKKAGLRYSTQSDKYTSGLNVWGTDTEVYVGWRMPIRGIRTPESRVQECLLQAENALVEAGLTVSWTQSRSGMKVSG